MVIIVGWRERYLTFHYDVEGKVTQSRAGKEIHPKGHCTPSDKDLTIHLRNILFFRALQQCNSTYVCQVDCLHISQSVLRLLACLYQLDQQ